MNYFVVISNWAFNFWVTNKLIHYHLLPFLVLRREICKVMIPAVTEMLNYKLAIGKPETE